MIDMPSLTKAEIEKLMVQPEPNKSDGELLHLKRLELYDVCKTCLDLYAKLEEMEKKREACLAYCKAQNGLPYCKNCGLGDNGDDWNPSIQACPADNPDCESCT